MLALALFFAPTHPAVRSALAGAGPAAVGSALAGAYRLEQRFVTDRRLGLVFLGALALTYLLVRPVLGWPPLSLGAALLVFWYLGPGAWASARAMDAWLHAGISDAARIAGAALSGTLLAVLLPIATAAIGDLVTGAVALTSLTLRLVTRVPVPVLLAAGAAVRILLPWSAGAG